MVAAESYYEDDESDVLDDLAGANAEAARRSLAEFCRQAVAAGEIEGTSSLEWGPHLDAICLHTQLQLEGWLVAYGKGTPDMVARQRAAWERTGATSDDGLPEPWLRYPLVTNQLYNIPPSTWKPCHIDGLVNERNRGLIRLGDVNVGDEVLTHRGRFRRVSWVEDQGIIQTMTIVTRRGRRIRVAGDHPMLTARGWVRADQVTTDDSLALVLPSDPSGSATISGQEARLLGYLTGDGHVCGKTTFVNEDPEALADFISCTESLGFVATARHRKPLAATHSQSTYVVSVTTRKPTACDCGSPLPPKFDTCIPCRKARLRSQAAEYRARRDYGSSLPDDHRSAVRRKGVTNWRIRHDIDGKNSYTKRVPQAVMGGSNEIAVEFLAAYWSCDGSMLERSDLGPRESGLSSARVEATTVSVGLALDIQHLLQRLGMSFAVRRRTRNLKSKRQGDQYISWQLVAYDQDTVAKFKALVGNRMRHSKRHALPNSRRSDFDRVLMPDEVTEIVQSPPGECRCLKVDEDESFSYQGVAVHNSSAVMICANAWVWLWEPKFHFVASSGIDANVTRDSNATRTLVKSAWFRATFQISWTDRDLAEDELPPDIEMSRAADAVSFWATTAGGRRSSRTWARGLTGVHGDCVAAGTMVATEVGDVAIEDLVTRCPMPRVWSMNHQTGGLELAKVNAWRRIRDRQTIDVAVDDGHVLTCTDDHRIFTETGYQKASESAGHTVSVLRWPESTWEQWPQAVSGMHDPDVDVCHVREAVHQGRGGACQDREERQEIRSVLLEAMFEDEPRRTSQNPRLSLRESVQAAKAAGIKTSLLASVYEHRPQAADVPGQTVSDMRHSDASDRQPEAFLFASMRREIALGGHERGQKFQLQEWDEQGVFRRSLARDGDPDPRTRRPCVRSLSNDGDQEAKPGASHRYEPGEQRPDEPDHTLRVLPHIAPQVVGRTVASVSTAPAGSSERTNTVYDIEVAVNNNFFASGILVHNCVFGDDPDDADRVYNEPARLATQNRWTRAMENRVNDERRSLRLIMQQVVHVEGFSAYLLSISVWSPQNPKGWARLMIPAEFGMGPADAPAVTPYGWRDWRKVKGETMHPRLSAGVLADRRLKMAGYEAQYNQNAERDTDGDFKRTAVRFFLFEGESTTLRRPEGCLQRTELPARVIKRSDLNRWTLNVDAAASLDPEPGARTSAVGLVVGACHKEDKYKDDRFIVDDRTRMLGPDGTYLAIYELIAAWELEIILVETKAIGVGVIAEIQRSIKRGWYLDASDQQVTLLGPDGKRPRCVVEPWNPGKDSKEQRHQGMLPAWRQGEVYVHDGAEWLYPKADANRRVIDEGFVGEICALPHSRKTERADMLAQFVAKYRGTNDGASRLRALNRLAMLGRR